MINNEKISELDVLSAANSSDLFMVSEVYSDTTYISKQISCNVLINEFIKTIEKIQYFNPSGAWIFNNGLTIPTKTVLSAFKNGLSSCVVNCDYLSSVFLKEFNKLSTDCSNYIPSSIGEVIYSTKLGTEKKMQKYYGPHTSWKKIEGRFICATDSNNFKLTRPEIMGGTELVTLDIKNFPAHSHVFKADTDAKEYSAEFTLTPETDPSDVAVISTSDRPGNLKPASETDYSEFETKVVLPAESILAHPTASLIHRDIFYGNDGEEATIYPFSSNESVKHNNMPTFFKVYMWERIE